MAIVSHRGVFSQSAIGLWKLGFNVLPFLQGDKRPPAGCRYRTWLSRRQTRAEVEDLISRFGWCDIGIITRNLVAFDMDNTAGQRAYQELRLPENTWITVSPRGGRHSIFRPAVPIATRTGFRNGLDLKAENGIVGVPPSQGRRTILGGPDHIADLPERILEKLPRYEPLPRRPGSGGSFNTSILSLNIRSGAEPFFRHREVVERIAGAFEDMTGLPVHADGSNFHCVLPGHEERRASAVIAADSSGRYVYFDNHRRDGRLILTLPEVYAALRRGRVLERMDGPTLATWGLRLLVDAGVRRPAAVDAALLPAVIRPAVGEIFDGFAHALACRWLQTPGAPAPWTWGFAALWCNLSKRHAKEATLYLRWLGYLRPVGEYRGITLYLPAPSSETDRLQRKARSHAALEAGH